MGNKLVTSAYDRPDYTQVTEDKCQKPVCPQHVNKPAESAPAAPSVQPAHRPLSKDLLKMTTMSIPSECPMSQAETDNKDKAEGCPVPHDQRKTTLEACPIPADFNTDNMMPAPNQMPSVGQPFPLSTSRVTSTIPKANAAPSEKWVYPSEQMFWNAMLRKGWRWEDDTVQKDDMTSIIHIHNANNEKAWHEVLMWEAMHCDECKEPKLKKFGGKASDYSPRAKMRHLMG